MGSLEADSRIEPGSGTDDIKKLYFEISSLCNLSCSMCFRHTWIDEGTGRLDADIVMKVLNEEAVLQTADTVFFGGMGEPLTHPGAAGFISAAHGKGKYTELITNGTMLRQKTSAALLESGLDRLWVSMDGFNRSTYENIRIGSRFDLITSNLDTFNNEKIRTGREDASIGITFVASSENISELKYLPEFMDRYNISAINISSMIPNSAELEKIIIYDRIVGIYQGNLEDVTPFREYDIPAMDLRNKEIAEAYEAIKSRLAPSRVPKDRDLSTKPWCRFVNEGNVFVSWDGDVVPCMGLLHSSYTNLYGTHRKVMRHSYGNVYKENLYDIWRKPDFTDFRERVRNWDFSPCILCGGCSNREENKEDCIGNQEPTCGACIWAFNVASCP